MNVSLSRRTTQVSRWAPIVVVALLLTSLAGRPAPAVAQDGERLTVVATFSILGDWVSNVGGDNVEVVTIVPAGGDAHTFDPSPEQVTSLAEADLVVEIGLGFEPWLDDMYEASGSTGARVVVSEGLDVISTEDGDEVEADEHEGEEEHAHDDATPADAHSHEDESEAAEHDHGSADPHIWHDVANAIASVETIQSALREADSANAATYQANADAYVTQLQQLDTSIRDQVATVPEDQRKLVTSHDTFAYYARAYGFEVIGTALGSISTESGDPSAQEIAALVETIEATGVPAIFAENVANEDLMQSIASEADVTLAPTLYTDALGEPGSAGETYINMMTYNTTTIVTALSGQ